VSFIPGWFDQTLPQFIPPAHDQLIINLDADLYTSTATVLTALEQWIEIGTFLFFDEFNSYWQERRALDEYMERTDARFKTLVADGPLRHIAFERVT
jgi:zona occludens toxin (predicted ATPase)